MRRNSSLSSPTDFQRVFQSGQVISNKYVVLKYCSRPETAESRVAFVAGKKIGNAVVRNRAKRLLREVYQKHRDKITRGYDIVVIARYSLKDRTYWEAEKGLLNALIAGGLIKK